MKPSAYEAGDYAGISANGFSAYYGYEQTKCGRCGGINCCEHDDAEKEWCFSAAFKVDGKEVIVNIPKSRLCDDNEGMMLPLLTGIGWLFAKYRLVPIEENKQ